MSSQFAISIERPPGDGWVRLPTRTQKRPGLLTAWRGKDQDLAEWSAAAARELLGPQADREQLDSRAEVMAGLAAGGRRRGVYLKYVWMAGPDAVPAAHVDVSLVRTSRAFPELTLDTLEEMYANRGAATTILKVSRVELPAGPAVRLHRAWQGTDDPSDTVVSVTYVCRPPEIKNALVYTMTWLIDNDDPGLPQYADNLATTLRIALG